MGWASGFQAGSALAERIMAAREKQARQADMEKLQQLRDGQSEVQSQQAAQEQAAIAQGIPLASAVPQAALPFEPAGLGQGQMSPVAQYTPPGQSPQGLQFAQAASELPTMSQADYLRRQADIYTKYGDSAAASQLMTQAQGLERQGVMDQRYDAQQRLEQQRYADEQKLEQKRANSDATRADAAARQADAVVVRTNETVKDLKAKRERDEQDRKTSQASKTGGRIYTNVMLRGGTYQEAQDLIFQEFPEDSVERRAAVTALQDTALTESGMSGAKVGSIYNRLVKPAQSVIAREYDSTDAQLKSYNKALSQFVDSNTFDGISAKIEFNEENGMYEVKEGDEITATFNTLDEIKQAANTEIEARAANPVQFAMEYQERATSAIKQQLASIEDAKARQEAYFEFIKNNPEVVRDAESLRIIERTYGVGGKPDVSELDEGDGEPKPKDLSVEGLGKYNASKDAKAQNEKANYERRVYELMDKYSYPELLKLNMSAGLLKGMEKQALSDAIAAKTPVPLESALY